MWQQWQTLFGVSRITADGDRSHEIKRCLLLGRKVMTNLDSILKRRDTTLPTKFHLVKAMVFPVVMYGCESRTIKKAECWGIDAFEPWCWRNVLRVPWIARRSNQPILKKISPEYSLEGLIWSQNSNILATWWEELTHWKRPRCWERLKAGGERDDRGWDGWIASSTQWTWAWVNSRSWWWTGSPGMLQSMGWQRVGHNWSNLAAAAYIKHLFSSVQSLSHVRLFATPWIAACQASLTITISRSSLRLTFIKLVMPPSHLFLCRPLLLLPPIPPSISLFQWVNSSHEVAKVLELQL